MDTKKYDRRVPFEMRKFGFKTSLMRLKYEQRESNMHTYAVKFSER